MGLVRNGRNANIVYTLRYIGKISTIIQSIIVNNFKIIRIYHQIKFYHQIVSAIKLQFTVCSKKQFKEI